MSGIQRKATTSKIHVDDRARWNRSRSRPSAPAIATLLLLCLGLSLSASCGREHPAPAPQDVAAPAKRQMLPTDFVVCIDNSGSISPSEQDLIRETTMLLADLADVGDRISVITFGSGARVGASVLIQGDADRIALRGKIRAAVDFKDSSSDLRAGLRVLATSRRSLLRTPDQADGAVILLTDGKLETPDGDVATALDQLLADLKGPLAGLDIYAIALGDVTSRDKILSRNGTAIDGQTLLRQYVAASPNRYFHAVSLNQVLDAAVLVLNETKGISSLGERGADRFRIDDTVESMSLIVRKRSSDGREICRSAEIEMIWPGGDPVTTQNAAKLLGENVYWNQDYQFFDLIVVRTPKPGIWEVRLSNGGTPEVLNKIVTPVELRFARKDKYFLNESATLSAWVFDRREAAISKAPYRLQAHLAADGDLAASNLYVPLKLDSLTNQFLLPVPADLNAAVGRAGQTGTVTVELIAERKKSAGSDDLDPWFIRRTAPFTVDVVEPFAEWTIQKQKLARVPLFGGLLSYASPFAPAVVPFGAVVDPSAAHYPDFLTPPRVTVYLRPPSEASARRQAPDAGHAIDATARGSKLAYALPLRLKGNGRFEYSYGLSGNTAQGAIQIASPRYTVSVRNGVEFLVLFIVLAVGLLQVVSDRLARLSGQVARTGAEYKLQRLHRNVETVREGAVELRLQARCFCGAVKKIDLHVVRGQVVVNGTRVAAGRRLRLLPKKRHQAILVQADGSQIPIEIQASVRLL